MRVATATLSALLLLAAGGLAGCGPAEEDDVAMDDGTGGEPAGDSGYDDGMDDEGEEAGQLFLEGELTDEGVECPAFRGEDGELYSLIGDTGGYRAGDRVRIVGEPVETSTCMQGTTVRVLEISAIDDEPAT